MADTHWEPVLMVRKLPCVEYSSSLISDRTGRLLGCWHALTPTGTAVPRLHRTPVEASMKPELGSARD